MGKKVLIVDDSAVNVRLLEYLLKGNGLDVTTAENGREALDKARLDPPDMVISDILMPEMDGYTLCRNWKSDERFRHIPFVFYTATYTEPRDEEFAVSLGADGFIIKPQDPDVLMDIVKEILGKKCTAKKSAAMPLGEDMEFFRRHDEALFKKLEKKILDLEIANQKLKALEEKYRLSFENVTDTITVLDADLRIVSISPSVERSFGYAPQDLVGRSLSELTAIMPPETLRQVSDDVKLAFKGGQVSERIYPFIAKDGTIKVGEVDGAALGRDGKIIGLISVARDITDRKSAEDELRRSGKKYRELYDFLPIPVYEVDLEGQLISANRAMYETFGGTEKDWGKGSLVWRLLTPEGADQFRETVQRLSAGASIERSEYTLRRLDGSTFPAISVYSAIHKDGRPVGFRGAIVDITERRRAEEELRRTNAFLDSIIENIPDMIFLKDAEELRFVRVNRAGENLMGYSRNELLGKNDYDFFPREQADSFTAKDREVLDGKVPVDIPEESLLSRDQGQRIVHTKKTPILNTNGKPEYLLGISEDISERKKAEEKLRQTLESLNKALATTIRVMISAVEARDPYTSGHQFRVADLASAMAEEMKLPRDRIEGIRISASIHDIGKLSIPAEILSKPTRLTEIEFSLIKEHPHIGFEILKEVESPWPLAEIVYQHHERMDGSGYPRNLKGDEILLEARIVGVADSVEAMASHRPYRPGLGIEAALKEIEDKRGVLFDAGVADACLRLFREKGYQLPESQDV